MAIGTISNTTIKDATGTTKTLTQVTDPNNSSYLAPRVFVDPSLNIVGHYSTGATQVTPAATPGLIIELKGSATKTVRIKKVIFHMTASTIVQWPVRFFRGAAACASDTGRVNPVITSYDTSDATATALVSHWTTDPTAAAANPASSSILVTNVTAAIPAGQQYPFVWIPADSTGKDFVLRGAADTFCITLQAKGLTAGELFGYSIFWAEDAS
jgi:hypothetical protein